MTQNVTIGNGSRYVITSAGSVRKTTENKYLFVHFNNSGKYDDGRGKAITEKWNTIVRRNQISNKARLFRSLVENRVTYGAEVCRISEEAKKELIWVMLDFDVDVLALLRWIGYLLRK